jgi:hypothetical protein
MPRESFLQAVRSLGGRVVYSDDDACGSIIIAVVKNGVGEFIAQYASSIKCPMLVEGVGFLTGEWVKWVGRWMTLDEWLSLVQGQAQLVHA